MSECLSQRAGNQWREHKKAEGSQDNKINALIAEELFLTIRICKNLPDHLLTLA